jgi:hypothetical protein
VSWWTYLVTVLMIPIGGYLGTLLGRRLERGEREAELDRREEISQQRGIRGTVKLSTMKIRR